MIDIINEDNIHENTGINQEYAGGYTIW
jgi:hypothetical protein